MTAPQPGNFKTWGTDVRIHAEPKKDSPVVRTLPGPTPIHVAFQVHGQPVSESGYTNDAWAFVPDLGGFISNIFVEAHEAWLPGVPEGQAGAPTPQPGPPVQSVDGLDQEQMNNARVIVQVGEQFNIAPKGIVIALATALQESSMRNVDHGDDAGPDSRGLFQQRDNWGTLQNRMDPAYAARAFYGVEPACTCRGLLQVPNWINMSVADAAQAVQVSANGSLYAPWENVANDLFNALK